MKKLLALVLALVMTMSLVTISNAAFSDADKIDHKEAVDVMNALGVINGMPDGSFTPAGNVTRAEMAKMITIILLGDVDASAFIGTTTDLTDINGHWAEGFIKYCYSQGVIAGNGNGTFAPNANVTASEAAKMLLVAIGYDADIQQYVGADWKINVARDAQTKRFYADLKGLTADKTLTRDEAAQMIYNAVQADGVKVTKGWNSENNTITYRYEDADSLLKSTFKATEVTGIVEDSILQTSGSYKGMYKLVIGTVSPAGSATEYYVKADYSALLAQKVSVMFFNKDKAGNYNPKDDTVFGVYADTKGIVSDVFAQSGVSVKADYKIKADGVEYTLDKVNGVWTVEVDGDITNSGTNVTANGLKNAASYATMKLVDQDGDGKYDVAVIYETKAEKITYVDSSKVIAGANTYKFADYKIESGLVKNDYVAMTYNFAEGCTELSKIEKLSGKVTGINTTDDKAEINGAWVYDLNNTVLALNNTYDYYVINGVLVKADKTTGADLTTLVFVADQNVNDFYKKALVYYTDGTSKTLKVDETSTGTDTVTEGKLYVLAGETDKGFKFQEINSTNFPSFTSEDKVFNGYTYVAGAAADINNTASAETNGAVTYIGGTAIADSAIVFAYDESMKTAKVITGEQLKSLSLGAAANNNNGVIDESYGSFTKKVNGITKVAVAAVQVEVKNNKWSDFTVTSASAGYGLVVTDVIDRDNYYEYTIWNGSENVTVKDKANNHLTKFSVVGYSKIDKDGYITVEETKVFGNAAVTTATAATASGALTGYEKTDTGYNLVVNGVALTADSKTVYMTINSAASSSDEIGVTGASAESLTTADKVYGQNCDNVIVYTPADDNVARVVILDVSNRLALKAATQYTISTVTNVTLKDAEGNALAAGDKVKTGDIITVTVGAGMTKLTTTNALDVTADPIAASTNATVTAGSSYIYVVGAGNPTFVAAA